MSDILQQISALSPERQTLLVESNPLSFLQQPLWFIAQMEPDSPAYNLPYAVILRGQLDVGILRRGLNEIIRRHEALRTIFPSFDTQPMQLVLPQLTLDVPLTDLSSLNGDEQRAELQRLVVTEAHRPFDLARGPLLRTALLRLSDAEHVLSLTMHHIVSDAWSTRILVRELGEFYNAFSTSREPVLPELPIQYSDYTLWQRQWLQGEQLESELAYWKERLAGAPSIIALPADRVRPLVQSFRGQTHVFKLSQAESDGLNELSRRADATLFMTWLALVSVLLSRYTAEEDIVIGSPIANRGLSETEGLIGFFVNTLALRTDLSGDPTFRELLARVREATVRDFAHQELPFERVVEEVRPERSLSYNPIFQVMLEIQSAAPPASAMAGVTLHPLPFDSEVAKFDLIVSVTKTPDGMGASITFNTDLFNHSTIVRLEKHLRSLIAEVVNYPERRLSQLSLLTPAERHQLLVEWNDRSKPYPLEKPLHKLIEEQVERTPDADAVVFEDERLSYREFNEKANQLARVLTAGGSVEEQFIPVLMNRSTELVISLFAILKAGAAFVPLDPNWPTERLKNCLADFKDAPVIVCRSTHSVARELGCQFLLVETPQLNGSPVNFNLNVNTRQPIYAMYTSGSTGRPKAAVVQHRGIVNRLFWMNEYFGPEAALVTLQTTHHVYDSSVWEFFWPLINGGKTVVPSPLMNPTAEYLTDVVAKHGVTILDLVPSVFNTIVSEFIEDPELYVKLNSLLCVVIGGEEITPSTTHAFLEHFPRVSVTNLYGPTEASIGCIAYQVKGTEGNVIPIGKPIANTQAFIVDRHMNPTPVGVPGELYLGGVCVGLGYLNDPEKTKQSFISNPFTELGSERVYRTGDLARYLPDGNIQYLGRLDHQLKIRGFRIEPGEIEAALEKHESIRKCAVVAREMMPGQKRLVAYVVAQNSQTLDVGDLRGFVQRKLPDYMLPAIFIQLDELPLTNGKIDRKALPAPGEQVSMPGEHEYVAPRNATEQMVADIWSEVLGLEQVGIRDDFFEVGGHSLLATQVISRLRKTFQLELGVRIIFENPTVESLAGILERERLDGERPQVPPIVAVSRKQPLPLSFSQQRLWFLDQLVPENAFYNIPSALRLKGTLDTAALEQAVGEIIRRHEILRTTFRSVEGQPVQVVHSPERPSLTITYLGEASEDKLSELAAAEAKRPFDLARGPLLRLGLFRLSETDHLLLLNMHHIISDGWSTGVLVRELASLYEAFTTGKSSPLPELPIQYADFAYWQRQLLTSDVLRGDVSYWKKQLADVRPLDLLAYRARPDVQSFRGARQALHLPKRLTEQLKSLSRAEGVTLFMTLLAAFQTLLFRYSNQDDIAVGSPIAGRNRKETENLIGFFINTLVLRSDLSGNPSFQELLARVREVCLAAYTHQELPFEQLVEELNPSRDTSRNPLFQVMFALHNLPRRHLELPGLTLSPLILDIGTAKFDLWLSLGEEADGLRGFLEYNTDLLDAEAATQMLAHFQLLLERIVENSDCRLSHIPLMTERERQLLLGWKTRAGEYPRDKCIHQLFEDQARRTPGDIAISFGDECLTYAELERRANQLAGYLRQLGVGPEVCVGLCVERSIKMVVGMLGVLKAGGAYVPLDPEYPQRRLAFMLEDADAALLITEQKFLKKISPQSIRVVCLDADQEALAHAGRAGESRVSAGNLAYMIYTSGSTGKPKGVQISHHSVINFLHSMKQQPGISRADVQLAVSSLSFDIAALEIFLPLTVGARVAIASKETTVDGAKLKDELTRSGTTMMQATPATWRMLTDSGWEGDVNLKILCGGEALPKDLAETLLRRGKEVWNLYGPTETTIWSTIEKLSPNNARISIGRAIANTQIYLLDAQLQQVPVGVPGELYIGGDGLARGYYKRVDLTAERFIPDAFGPDHGNRLYRTGDLARHLPDGSIECLGRIDHQVKVRGFRIELDEIEVSLQTHPGVREAAVVTRESHAGEKQLVAYIVPDPFYRSVEAPHSRENLDAEQVSQWQTVWGETYQQAPSSQDPTFNINGWVSSFTGLPIPAEEMREWVDRTVDLIKSLHPRRVLDIGCGSGLLLFPLAPECVAYCGTDITPSSITNLRQQFAKSAPSWSHVTLHNRSADDFRDFSPRSFDTVILNSVVQYFPSIDYLLRVLEGAVNVVKDGGVVFIGDVRSLPLLPAFYASVEVSHAHPAVTRQQLQQRLHKRLLEEEELVVDPAFFMALRQLLPRIRAVSIRPKRGRFMNELTRFRYEVILHVGPAIPADNSYAGVNVMDWQPAGVMLPAVRELLLDHKTRALHLNRIPNKRVMKELQLVRLLADGDGPNTVGDLRTTLEKISAEDGIDQEAFWTLGDELQYEVEFTWANSTDGVYDVVFRRRVENGPAQPMTFLPEQPAPVKPLSQYANDPLQGRMIRNLIPELRRDLGTKLPTYMMPSAIVPLMGLPLTPNSKVDRGALSSLDWTISAEREAFVAARDQLELQLTHLWEDIVGVKPVGVKDNFFTLGGHSLLAVRLISQIRSKFGRDLPLTSLFQGGTIEHLAGILRRQGETTAAPSLLVEIQPGGTRQPLFFVHPAGGNVLCYYELAHLLNPEQPFFGIQSPGLNDTNAAAKTIEQMAAGYIEELRRLQPEEPYQLGGWSMGGLVAFEMAQQLHTAGQSVSPLILLDVYPPSADEEEDDASLVRRFALDLGLPFDRLNSLPQDFSGLKNNKVLSYLLDQAKAHSIVPPDIELDTVNRLFQVFTNNFRAMLNYRPRTYSGHVVLIKAGERRRAGRQPEEWSHLIAGGLTIHSVAGNHYTMIKAPHVQRVAALVDSFLEGEQATREASLIDLGALYGRS